MILIVILLSLIATPALCGDIPSWVSNVLQHEYTQVSDKTDAILLLSDSDVSYDNGAIITHNKRLYKITKLEGLGYGTLYVSGEKGTRVSQVKGYRLNSSGQFMEKLKRKNIIRRAFNTSFYDDAEQLFAKFEKVEIGDYIAFEYKVRSKPFFKQCFFAFGSMIEIGTMRVHVPADANSAVLNDPDNQVVFSGRTYEILNRPAEEDESYGPSLKELVPVLGITFDQAPDKTWEDLSREIFGKISDVTTLSESSAAELNALLSIQDRERFIEKALAFVSQNVRYADIEVGDGKFIPTECNTVHQKKYGDCKDMAYYAIAILKKGGVNAIPVLALTKSAGPVFESFPSSQFNHAIIAVELDSDQSPLKNIDIQGKPYLIADLTDKYTKPPMIGYHIENTRALPITEAGSSLLTLPVSTADQSIKKYDIKLRYGSNKSITGTISETLSGHYMALERDVRAEKDTQEKETMYREWIQKLIPGAELISTAVNEDNPDSINCVVEFKANNMGTDVNGTLYLGPNIIDSTRKGYRRRTRSTDMLNSFLYSKQIHIEIEMDPVYQIQDIPKACQLDNAFFTFDLEAVEKGQTVVIDISFTSKRHRISADEYPAYRKVFKKYLKSAKSQLALGVNS